MDTNELKLSIDLLEGYIKFFVRYVKFLPEVLIEYIEGVNLHKYMYLVNNRISIVAAFHELFDTIIKIFNGQSSYSYKIYSSYNPLFDKRQLRFFFINRFELLTHTRNFV